MARVGAGMERRQQAEAVGGQGGPGHAEQRGAGAELDQGARPQLVEGLEGGSELDGAAAVADPVGGGGGVGAGRGAGRVGDEALATRPRWTAASSAARASRAGSTRGEWKARLTRNGWQLMPWALSSATSASRGPAAPDTTVSVGVLTAAMARWAGS